MATSLHHETASQHTDHLSGLPVELLTTILSQLSVSEIRQARRLNTTFKAIIDTNESIISGPIITRHKARLSFDYQVVCHPSADLHTAFQGYVNHYRAPNGRTHRIRQPEHFVKALINEHYLNVPGKDLSRILLAIASFLLKNEQSRDRTQHQYIDEDSGYSRFARVHGVGQPFRELADILDIVPTSSSLTAMRMAGMELNNDRETQFHIDFILLNAVTTSQLNLPSIDIPYVGIPYVGSDYYVSRRKLERLILKGWKSGRPFSALEAAALIEEAFIY